MSLRAAFQMDPMEAIKIAGDSSFALMLSAQDRGHALWHYDVQSLAWKSDGSPAGKITAYARPVKVRRNGALDGALNTALPAGRHHVPDRIQSL